MIHDYNLYEFGFINFLRYMIYILYDNDIK